MLREAPGNLRIRDGLCWYVIPSLRRHKTSPSKICWSYIDFFGVGRVAAARKSATKLAAVVGTRGVATGTCKNELTLAPKTGFDLSTCSQVVFKSGENCGLSHVFQRRGCD